MSYDALDIPEVGAVLDQLGLYEIPESAICASELLHPKHLARTHHPASPHEKPLMAPATRKQLTKGILTVLVSCQVGW